METVSSLRISVVIIVFNLEDYLGQAIDSVLRQTRQADEIIVVDDCSTDNSADRVKAYEKRVRYLRTPKNSGALIAALQGVKAASGDIISMLDGDDFWSENKLEVVEREFRANSNLLLLSHDHVRVDEKGTELHIWDDTHRNILLLRRRAESADHFSDLLRATILQQKGYWLGSAYSFRRKLFAVPLFEKQVAKFGFEKLRKTYLDLTLAPFLVLTNPSNDIGYTPDTKLFYRVHDMGSLSDNATPEKAQRSALKGRAINELIFAILRENNASTAHLQRRKFILIEYDFLCFLYQGRYAKATRLYLLLALHHWNWRQLLKETKRLVAIRLLGPQKFLTLKNRL